jgi:four helix bundle protein
VDELDMKKRTKDFALRAIKLADALPRTLAGKTIGGQLVRAATSVAANYRAACRARSGADFRNKLAVCEEESDESGFWIELAAEADLMPPRRLRELLDESNELTAILAASRRTSARRRA